MERAIPNEKFYDKNGQRPTPTKRQARVLKLRSKFIQTQRLLREKKKKKKNYKIFDFLDIKEITRQLYPSSIG